MRTTGLDGPSEHHSPLAVPAAAGIGDLALRVNTELVFAMV